MKRLAIVEFAVAVVFAVIFAAELPNIVHFFAQQLAAQMGAAQ